MQLLVFLLCVLVLLIAIEAVSELDLNNIIESFIQKNKDDFLKDTRSKLSAEPKFQFDKNVPKLQLIQKLQRKLLRSDQNKTSNVASSPPIKNNKHQFKDDPMKNPNMFEGDMLLTDIQIDGFIEHLKKQLNIKGGTTSNRNRRSVQSPMNLKWTFPIKYFISPLIPQPTQTIIDDALADMHSNTCLRFSKQSASFNDTPGLSLTYGTGCWSYVGQVFKNKPQEVSLGDGCQYRGVIQHEISHALGLQHEQSRPDRDNYLIINKDNMAPTSEGQFTKSLEGSVNDYGVQLDMGLLICCSAMMYGSYDFSKNNQKTIYPKEAVFDENLGQYSRLSFSDYKILTFHYCNSTCDIKISCSNGGYQNPNSCTKCVCPNGFAGTLCAAIKTTGSECGTIELTATDSIEVLTKTGAINCFFKITTDPKFKIRIIVKKVNVSYQSPCVVGKGLEVKFQKDMTNSGAAFCGTSTYHRTMVSVNNFVMVHYPGLASTHSFSLTYQRVA
uniref:Zinc metalloproteinase n=1 Tax=Rhabditophanes sp. KR3021 TaxID=114890 RepID=A0AC35U9T0_9BILA